MAETKAARKNRKRREARKETGGFNIEEDVPSVSKTPSIPPVNPLTELQRQLAEAKTAKDHDKAQEVRHKIWVLQDTLELGKPPSGAPAVDILPVLAQTNKPKVQIESTTSDPTERKLLKLRKKLEQIEALKQRKADGEKLEKNQLLKIETQSEVEDEVRILEDLLRTGS